MKWLVVSLIVLSVAQAALAEIIRVPEDQPTLQAAVLLAFDGDEIIVADGVYTGPGNRDIDLLGKLIHVHSENGPDNCIIDCENQGRGLILQSGEFVETQIEGFTVLNAQGGGLGGPAILIVQSSPVIRACVFRQSVLTLGNGGAAVIREPLAAPLFVDCVFIENGGQGDGGAVSVNLGATPFFVNCLFADNESLGNGGAIHVSQTSTPSFVNCTISNNQAAGTGGGILANGQSVIARNCIIWGNTPNQIAGGGKTRAIVSYSDVQGGWPGTGNIDADPLFVPTNGNYRLQSTSSCIDAADNDAVPIGTTTDLDGNPRFQDDPDTPDTGNGTAPIVDMGPYEYQPPAQPETVLPASFNVAFGDYQGGTITDLHESDDAYVVIGQRAAVSVLLPLIRLEIDGAATEDTATALEVTLEAAATALPTQPPQRLSLFNYDSATHEIVDERIATLSDSVVVVNITTDAQRFVEVGTGNMAMRVEWFHPGDVFSPAWQARIDQAVWVVTP